MSKLDALRNATPEVYAVLKAFLAGYSDYYYNYSYLQSETKLTRKQLEPVIKVLKAWGYIVYARGLMNEDGEMGGSGWQIPYELRDEVELAIDYYELKDEPREINIAGITYSLVRKDEE